MEIKLEGAVNVRDLGGLKTKDGRTIKEKRLIRSDTLNSITKDDEAILVKDIDLARIIDLRTDNELKELASASIDGVEWLHIPLIKGGAAAREEPAKLSLTDIFKASIAQMDYNVPKAMTEMYQSLMTDDYPIAQTKEFFEVLLSHDSGATLWHCTAGKDRTGFLTILLLELLSVDRQTIVADYMISEKNLRPQTDSIIDEIRKETDDELLIEQVRLLNGVIPEYTEVIFGDLDRAGGIEQYLIDKVGMSVADLEKIKSMYLL